MIRVNIFSDALDGLGRWYVAVPPFLIISFLAALFFVTGEGQARLQEAGERLSYRERYWFSQGRAVQLRCARPAASASGAAWNSAFDRGCDAIAAKLQS